MFGSRSSSSCRRFLALPLLFTIASGSCGGESGTGPPEDRAIASVMISSVTDVMVEGTVLDLDAVARTLDGDTVRDRTILWTSADTVIATISPTGRVVARSEGSVAIVAEAEGNQDSILLRVAPAAIQLLRSPFDGSFALINPVDHRYPRYYDDPDPRFIDWRGVDLAQRLNGHDGYDWIMPVGTPILAAGDGYVNFAGEEQPWSCPLLGGQEVSGKYVNLVHTAPSGERFTTVYLHLDRIDVEQGQEVSAGDPVGLSGNTGCSTGPHLHFEMGREFYTRADETNRVATTDPSGWSGAGSDPWLLQPDGAASSRLWIPGSEPPLTPFTGTAAPGAAAPGAKVIPWAMDAPAPGVQHSRLGRLPSRP